VTIDVLNNDSDKDGDNLTIVDVSSANKGHVRVSNGKIVYTPNSGFVGHDNFTYTVTDGKQSFATATVAVSVTAPPVISNGNIVTLTNKHFHANLTDIWGKAKTSLYTGSKTQWKLIASGNDTYKLKNVKSGRYLDGDSHGVDTTYHSTSHGTDWKFQQDSSGAYFLFNADYHKYLDANGKYTSVAWDPGHTEADDLWIVKSVH